MAKGVNVIDAYFVFVDQVLQGKEGVFFSSRNHDGGVQCFFGFGKKEEIEDKYFQCFDFKGEKNKKIAFENMYDSTDALTVLSDQRKEEIMTLFQGLWISESRMLEDCSNQTAKSFAQSIHKAQKAQRKGDMWVINLTHKLSGSLENPETLLACFARFLELGESHVGGIWFTSEQKYCSFSPEQFISFKDSVLITRPIKGTGTKKELEESEKEVSELSMVTDLLRNDIGIIADKVWVESERDLTKHKGFYHASATIAGQIDEKGLTEDRVKKLLPAGSISGCPKQRVCEYIDQLESYERGMYTGIFGVVWGRSFALYNILIRTLFWEDGKWSFPVGAGITHLSDPVEEWNETLLKAEFLKTCCLQSR